ncbi:hypothetical protein [Lamprocystis purpurea]|jgi:hypothetical protein|uniref:hypothetical protein n=1 Tax=Lamprocystis purpurea TaxID=61598 RepID=UPI0003A6BBFE|nr:hypothetical protein [Lamprocystis purpurea]
MGKLAKHRLPSPAEPVPEPARQCWLVRHLDGSVAAHSFTPPATFDEVRTWYPDALSIEPEQTAEPFSDPDLLPDATLRPATPVTCGTCAHWVPDPIGDGAGLGVCLADAPASREPGSLWPAIKLYCRYHSDSDRR